MTASPSLEARRRRAADVGLWLVAASLIMFVASLFSGYVLLRVGSESWIAPWRSVQSGLLPDPWFRLLWLVVAAAMTRAAGQERSAGGSWVTRHPLALAALAGTAFVARTIGTGRALAAAGHEPASHVAMASWFALNGVVAALALGGAMASVWVAVDGGPDPEAPSRRIRNLLRYWTLVAGCFAVVVIGMYLL